MNPHSCYGIAVMGIFVFVYHNPVVVFLSWIDAYYLPFIAFFADAIDKANSALLAEQKKLSAVFSMKTTLTVLALQNGMFQCAHVGDSRIYHFRKNKVVSRTIDHSIFTEKGRIYIRCPLIQPRPFTSEK